MLLIVGVGMLLVVGILAPVGMILIEIVLGLLAAWQMSITYSPQIVGSLYVKAIDGAPYCFASSGTSWGGSDTEWA